MFTKHELETILYSLEGYIQGNDDDKLSDELVGICDKIIEELAPVGAYTDNDNAPVIINLPEGTNLTRVIRSDDDYASKVDRLVDNMVASDDNNTDKVYPEVDDLPDNIKKEWLYDYSHDSEGC